MSTWWRESFLRSRERIQENGEVKMKHVSLRYPPASGGVEDYVHALVERLRAAGDDVEVETTSLRTHHPASYLAGPLHDPPYVHRHPVRTLGPIAYPVPLGLNRTLETGNGGLIHAHGFWYAPADIAARVAKHRGIPFVFNPYYAPRTKPLWRLYRHAIGAQTLATADAVVVISPQEEAALRHDGFPLRRVALIPPGINGKEFSDTAENPFARRGMRGPVLFFAGRITRAKGVDILLRALSLILNAENDPSSVHLAIAGEDFGDRAEFERLADRLGITRAVTWLAHLPREELLAAYRHASVFVFPSRFEAFGIAPLEAQAAGCPVVATNVASLPFVVQHEQTGLLCRPEDPADVAAKVVTLLHNRALSTRLAAAGRTRVHRHFTWEQSIRTLRTLYADLLQQRR